MNIDIPVKDINRAKKFYERLFRKEMTFRFAKNDEKILLLKPKNTREVFARLVEEEAFIPDMFGIIVYFESQEDLAIKLAKVKKLGGKVLDELPKDQETPNYKALIQDSEGNRIALFIQGKS